VRFASIAFQFDEREKAWGSPLSSLLISTFHFLISIFLSRSHNRPEVRHVMSQLPPGQLARNQLRDDQQRQLVSDLVAAVKTISPDWTSRSSSDPGITLLELLAWLADPCDFRLDQAPDTKADLLNNLIAKLVGVRPGPCTTSFLTRPRYFYGQLLSAADFQAEQDYSRNMMKRHNCCLFWHRHRHGTARHRGFNYLNEKRTCHCRCSGLRDCPRWPAVERL
jgi:hypothetical protein